MWPNLKLTLSLFRDVQTGPQELGDMIHGNQESAFLLSNPQAGYFPLYHSILYYPLLQYFIFTKNPTPSNVPLF